MKRELSPTRSDRPLARQRQRIEDPAVSPLPLPSSSSSERPALERPELDAQLPPAPTQPQTHEPEPFPSTEPYPDLPPPEVIDELDDDDIIIIEPESAVPARQPAPTRTRLPVPPTPTPASDPPAPAMHQPLVPAPDPSIAREGKEPTEIETLADLWRHGLFEQVQEPVYPPDAALNARVSVWRGDITSIAVDAIVNAANRALLGGGGVDGAIHSAAGRKLYEECKLLAGAETGESKITHGYRLPSKFVIHTVGPVYSRANKQECEALLRSCYQTTLEVAVANNVQTLAFSGISTGVYGYPLDAATRVALDVTRTFMASPEGASLKQVIFTVFRQIDVDSYMSIIPEFFPPSPIGQVAVLEPAGAEPFLESDGLKEIDGEAPETPAASASVADDVAAVQAALPPDAPEVVVFDETTSVAENSAAAEGSSKWGCVIA